MTGTYIVYKATYGRYVYYGITTSLKKRRLDHIRNYSIVHYGSTSNYSKDRLTTTARMIGVSPAQWEFTVVYDGLSKSDALSLKAMMVRQDDNSINFVYKNRR